MRHFWIMPCLLLLAMPAHAAIEDVYARWERLRDPNAPYVTFEEGSAFLKEHPGWPEEKLIRLRTEAAAMLERPTRAAMEKFCTDYPPISGRGMIACASKGGGDKAKEAALVKQAWLQGDFNEDEEERILKSYGDLFRGVDHALRAERLMYEGKVSAAKRMLPRVSPDRRVLYNVRLAFIEGDKRAPKLLEKLPASSQRDPGMLFERLRWRAGKNMDDGLAELLLMAPAEVPYPDLWWPMRARAAREAIAKGNYDQALAVIKNHGELKPEAMADALWLKGWISLRHRNDAKTGYKDFFTLYSAVSTPVSKARAAYWAGRAAEKNGNKDIATEWMEKAARHPTVFYGQLAQHWLHPGEKLVLPEMPEPGSGEKQPFASDELILAARMLHDAGDAKMRDAFIATYAARPENTPGQFALLAEFAQHLGGTASGVDVAKLALRSGVVLIDAGWPRIGLPGNLRLEPALTLAITRQESEFDPTARSSADARGLMQLLPSTAKQTAKKLDIDYKDALLEEPGVNLTLGTSYLGQIIDGFDGSYILGIASYNAGPGSVRSWIARMGTPPKRIEDAVDWIESIPFGETRNYVMRALENVNMYRTLADEDAPLAIDKDLKR